MPVPDEAPLRKYVLLFDKNVTPLDKLTVKADSVVYTDNTVILRQDKRIVAISHIMHLVSLHETDDI